MKQLHGYAPIAARAIVMLALGVSLLEMTGVVKDTFSAQHPDAHRAILAVVIIAFVYLATRRDTYLPFLGPAALPPSVMPITAPISANAPGALTLSLDADPTADKVVWWAANPAELKDGIGAHPREAYNGFKNAGVAAVVDGKASITLLCPQRYRVPMSSDPLPKHVHYREVFDNGMLGAVKTTPVIC